MVVKITEKKKKDLFGGNMVKATSCMGNSSPVKLHFLCLKQCWGNLSSGAGQASTPVYNTPKQAFL